VPYSAENRSLGNVGMTSVKKIITF